MTLKVCSSAAFLAISTVTCPPKIVLHPPQRRAGLRSRCPPAGFAPRLRLGLQRCSACSAPLRSVTSPVVTATACGSPWVSTAIWRLMPRPSCLRHSPSRLLCPCSSRFVRPRSRACCMRCAPQSLAGRGNLIFLGQACCSRLTPCVSGKGCRSIGRRYECTVRQLGNSLGSARHWQPVRSRYNTAHHTWSEVHGAGLGLLARPLQQGLDRSRIARGSCRCGYFLRSRPSNC